MEGPVAGHRRARAGRLLCGGIAALSLAACNGTIGSTRGGAGADVNGGGAGAGGPPGSAAGGGGGAIDAGAPFETLPVASYVGKVKTVLTGMAATQAEIDAVSGAPASLGTLVDGWMKLPAYRAKMERFFADAFQQSQAQSQDWKSVIDDGIYTPGDPLLLNFRQSFAKTMTELTSAGEPFTAAATTRRHMMTTAMMVYYAYTDTSMLTDATDKGAGRLVNRLIQSDAKFSFTLTSKRTIPIADSGNPSSPDYLVFSLPNLAGQYGTTDNAAYCGGVDPVV